MARAKKTTTAKTTKAKAPKKVAAPKGVDATELVDALNNDYAGACKRQFEIGLKTEDIDTNAKRFFEDQLDSIKEGTFEYGRKFMTVGGKTHTALQYEDPNGTTVVGFIDNKSGDLLQASDGKPGNPSGYNVTNPDSLNKAVAQADWGANFIYSPQE